MKIALLLTFISSFVFSQGVFPKFYKINTLDFDSSAIRGLTTNVIGDILPQSDTLLWLGTGSGLAVLRDTSSIFTLSTNKNIAEGQATTSTPQEQFQSQKTHWLELTIGPLKHKTCQTLTVILLKDKLL